MLNFVHTAGTDRGAKWSCCRTMLSTTTFHSRVFIPILGAATVGIDVEVSEKRNRLIAVYNASQWLFA